MAIGAAPIAARGQAPAPVPADAAALAAPRPRGSLFEVHRATSAMRIDARLDEAAWQEAGPIPLPIEIAPRDNVPADVATDCRITYDDRHLYLGCEALDPDPGSIRAYVTNRDGIIGNHDRISLLVDPFNDSRRGFVFEVSAVGVQADLVYDERTRFDASWDAIWSSAGRITERGFVIEAAIPFRSLRFPSTDGVQRWRFWINRMRPRSEVAVMRTNARRRDELCELCQAHLLTGFSGIDPGLNVELVPTLTGRRSASRAATFPDGPLASGPAELAPGLDARWSITSNMSLNATVNPDFSQVEADTPQLDANAAFALRYAEKRAFFLEGADLFATPLEVVFTRTIRDPAGGVKLTGKSGPHAIGVLAAVDERNGLLLPGPFGSRDTVLEQRVASTVLRYRRDVGANGTVGAIYTGRFAGGDYRNQLAGLDVHARPTSTLTWSAQALASESRHGDAIAALLGEPSSAFSGQALWSRLAYVGRAWFGAASGELRTAGFRADAGFLPQADLRSVALSGGHMLRGSGGSLTLLETSAGAWQSTRIGGAPISDGVWLNLYYEGPLQARAWLNPQWSREAFEGARHELLAVWAGVEARPLPGLRLGLSGNLGDQIDFRNGGVGRVRRVSPSLDAQVGRHVELGAEHSSQRLTRDGASVLTARVDELRGVVNLNTRAFVRGALQFRRTHRSPARNPGLERTVDEALFGQLLLSYKVNPLTVAFLGLTDDRVGFDDQAAGRLPLTPRARTLFFKLGYAWRP